MEVTAAPEGTTGRAENLKTSERLMMSGKPLHRFLQKEPRSLGISILIFGCAELLMGFQLNREKELTSNHIYIPFWQGTLFFICGILSILTDLRPSKKMVTICLAMYVISILGILVSFGYRVYIFTFTSYTWYRSMWGDIWGYYTVVQIISIEALLFTSSLCVSGILIFLSTVARFALKSTHTQVIVHCVPRAEPVNDTTSD